MAKKNKQGIYIDAHSDNRGTSHISIYDRDPSKGEHDSIYINIRNDWTGTIVEKDSNGKTSTDIDLKK